MVIIRQISVLAILLLVASVASADENGQLTSNLFSFEDASSGLPLVSTKLDSEVGDAASSSLNGDVYFTRSVLLPGWGQLTAGKKIRGYSFLAAEAIFIGSFFFLRQQSSWFKDDYESYARQFAGIKGSHSHQFYVDIGNWMNTEEFNEQRLLNRQFDNLYKRSEDQWQWSSDDHRATFESIRLNSDKSKQNATLMIGGLFLNHLISAVDASGLGKVDGKLLVRTSARSDISIDLIIK